MIAAYFLMATAVAALFSRTLRGLAPNYALWIVGIVIGYTALLLPAQIVAALQLAGILSRMPESAWLAFQALLMAGAVLVHFRSNSLRPLSDRPSIAAQTPGTDRLPRHLKIGIAVMAATLFLFVIRAFFAFPAGYDANAYHYLEALRWLQDGSLHMEKGTIWYFSLPGNGELLMMLTLAARHDRWLIWVTWPSTVLLILSFRYLCARPFALPRSFVPVTLTAISIPMVCYQTFSGYVDVMGVALLLGALALVLIFAEHATNREGKRAIWLLFVAGLSCGIASGTKPTFWPLVALLSIGIAIGLGRAMRWRNHVFITGLSLFLAGLIIPSAFWFCRAWYETGNPLYPMQVTIFGHTFAGFVATGNSGIAPSEYAFEFVRRPIEWLVYPWTEWKRHSGYLLQSYSEVTGLGGMFATFTIPGVFYTLWLCFRRKGNYALWAWLLGLLALLLVSWWFLYDKNLRYIVALPVLACLLTAPFFEVMESWRTRTYRVLFVAALAATCAVLVFEPVHAIASTLRSGDWSRSANYGYPERMDHLPPGAVLLNLASDSFDFPLAGKNLSTRVISPLEIASPVTREYLRKNHVEYIVQEFELLPGAQLAEPPPFPGLVLAYSRDTKLEDGTITRWLLWRVQDASTAKP